MPFSEGNEDLIYSYLILVIYKTFCLEKSKPEEDIKSVNSYKSAINNFNAKEDLKPEQQKEQKEREISTLLK